MSHGGFSIHKFVGVTPKQLTELDRVLKSKPIVDEEKFGETWLSYGCYAAIKSTKWDERHKTLTVEVEVYDFQKFSKHPTDLDSCTFNEKRPTKRWVTDAIFNALERFEDAVA